MRLAIAALTFLGLAACRVETSDPWVPEEDPGRSPTQTAEEKPPAVATPKPKPTNEDKPADVANGVMAEAVYVHMHDKNGGFWICTGALVSKRTVVTAAHCLDTKMFVSYEVVAPLAPNKPRVAASSPMIFGGDYEDVANPDIGILTLKTPIVLPAYAMLTDVVNRVATGDAIKGLSVVRTTEKAESPLSPSEPLAVSSTVDFGYAHGFGTPMFSKGGDSGAGLYLVENGKPTHKLIGIARQPDPDRGIDHFTRIDAAFMEWFAAHTTTDG